MPGIRRCIIAIAAIAASSSAALAEETCRESSETQIWWSPREPVAGGTLKLMAVSEVGQETELELALSGQPTKRLATSRRGGPPFSFAADTKVSSAGTVKVNVLQRGRQVACRKIVVATRGRTAPPAQGAGAWATTREWSRATESFFSAWIERMFDAPVEASFAFPSLAPILRDSSKNFLWGYLGAREDDPKNREIPRAVPDCADLPYYLRAYFAWKLGLPFALRDCDRGKTDRPPKCGPILHNEQADEGIRGSTTLERFRSFLRILANRVHSGSARTALTDEQSDFYPIALTRAALRPGTIFADPYGHVLMVVSWVDQKPGRGGQLLAVDGQPDNSVGRKRFWEGTFLFDSDVRSAGPGFKAFRPVVRQPDGTLAPLSNAALTKDRRFAPFSDEQSRLDRDAFYARIATLVNPTGLDARAAYDETMNALVEQLGTRIASVDNGEKFMREKNNPLVPMPAGPKIFETTGPWEDYATPSRDMRLLIALGVLAGLPDRVSKHPELFVLGTRSPAEVRAEIEALHRKQIHERAIDYKRSDGSSFRLTVADILARRSALEMAYNPNDCVEVRWGAAEGTPEIATCRRRAPEDQRARMQEYRSWFRDARRPPR